jgi:hypothetical protein
MRGFFFARRSRAKPRASGICKQKARRMAGLSLDGNEATVS